MSFTTAAAGPCTETYVTEGAFVTSGRVYGVGSYLFRRAVEVEIATDEGFVAFEAGFSDSVDKESVALTAADIDALPWEHSPGRPDRFNRKVLAHGPSGSTTAIGRIEKGCRSGTEPDVHGSGNENLILYGRVRVANAGVYSGGMYTCFPAGVPDGPYVFEERLESLIIRNH
jgi:hypothetical protein